MGVSEGIALAYFLTNTRIFLTVPSGIINGNAGISWLSPLVATTAALVMFYLVVFIMKKVPGDLPAVGERLLGPIGFWFVALVYIAIFSADAILLLRQFAENTLLTALPYAGFQAVVGWYALCAAVIVALGIEAIARAAYILLPISIAALMVVLALLVPFYEVLALAPWSGNGVGEVVGRGLSLAGINTGVMLLVILRPDFQSLRAITAAAFFGMVSGALLRSLTIMCFIMAFGVGPAAEKTLPFFEMARLVYLSRYVQRVESLFILLWVVVGLLAIAINIYLVLYLLSRVLKLPALRPIVAPVVVLFSELAMMPPDIHAAIMLDRTYLLWLASAGVYVVPVILLAALLVKGRRRRAWASG
jgi:spore germination protein (amino acid permease)